MRDVSKEIFWWKPEVGQIELRYLQEVVASNYLNDGDMTRRLEALFAQKTGGAYAIAVTSGTAALTLALQSVGIGHGDEVLVPDITFIATANAVKLAGGEPVLVDVDPLTLSMSLEDMKGKINHRTKAIIPVHISGRYGQFEDVMRFAENANIIVIEDAAEALGSYYKGKALGTFGALGCFSLSPNKTITCGQGGIIVTNSEDLHQRLRELKDQGRSTIGSGADDKHASIGYNFKLTNLQAAVGVGQFEVLDGRLARQRRNYEIYREELSAIEQVSLFDVATQEGETPQWTDGLFQKKEELYDFLQKRGIQCRRFWYPLHWNAPYRKADIYFPNSTAVWHQAMWLPSGFQLTDEDIRYVADIVREFYG